MPGDVLSTRELNRALLGRQLLLKRASMPIGEALEHLVGLQAQVPTDPYYGLWSRLHDFDPDELGGMVERGEAVRTSVMRGTIHLATARDALLLRAVMDPVMRATFESSAHKKAVEGADIKAVSEEAMRLVSAKPLSRSELACALGERWPEFDARELAHAAHFMLPIAQVPPRGVWGRTMQPKWSPLEQVTGGRIDWGADIGEAVLRYLRAYGPAATKDVRAWCYRTGLREVIDTLRPRLRVFRTERGGELFDVEDGLFPDPEAPAPVRFLPEFDNATLSFADRSRILEPSEAPRPYWKGTVLVDGFASGTWRVVRAKGEARLEVGTWRKLSKGEREEVESEAAALLEWSERAAEAREVVVVPT